MVASKNPETCDDGAEKLKQVAGTYHVCAGKKAVFCLQIDCKCLACQIVRKVECALGYVYTAGHKAAEGNPDMLNEVWEFVVGLAQKYATTEDETDDDS